MIEFVLNDEVIKSSSKRGMTLLDFIRYEKGQKGTKIGCREGDCGACTVLVGELIKDQVYYKTVTSCISPLGNAHGKHIVTIEGINLNSNLNVAQKVIYDNYATQCGFCTPGFVVSLTGHALPNKKNTLKEINDSLSGNICRCTGYKSIEKAAKVFDEKLINSNNTDKIKWLVEENYIPKYFIKIPELLKRIKPYSQNGGNVIVANGTDIYVRYADKMAEESVQLISDEKSLKGIVKKKERCIIGASTTVTELLNNALINKIFPNLKEYIRLVSSDQIRNMGTLGGNFVNASPIGDLSVFFLALDSTITIRTDKGVKRNIPFNEFHIDYKKYDMKEKELIESISFEIFSKETRFNFEKVSKRTHLDIASVNSAFSITTNEGIINYARISLGGVAAIPKYLSKTSRFLLGKKINKKTILDAEELLQSEIEPISDIRGNAEYKRLLARQLFFAHFLKIFPTKVKPQTLLRI